MKNQILLALLFVACSLIGNAQTPNWLWAENQAGGSCYTEAHQLAVSASGDIYVTGRFGGTITMGGQTATATVAGQVISGKFNSSGTCSWLSPSSTDGTTDYNDGMCIDKSNNTITVGIMSGGFYIDKLNSSGVQQWIYNAFGTSSDAFGVVADNNKNIYVTGEYQGSLTLGSTTLNSNAGSNDMFLAKLDSNGNWLWAVSAGGSGFDGGRSVALDASGYLYVSGSYSADATFGTITAPTATGTYPNLFVAKYDQSGNALRVSTATNSGFTNSNQWYVFQGLAVDSCGNAYVAGLFTSTAAFGNFSVTSAGSNDIYVAKCNQNGSWEWVQRFGGAGPDLAYTVALDKYADVYIGGEFTDTAQFGNQYFISTATNKEGSPFVAKCSNSTGDLQWVQVGTGTGNWYFTGLGVDKNGYVYASGIGGSGTGIFGKDTVTDNNNCYYHTNFLVTKLDTTPPRRIVPTVNSNYCPGAKVKLPYTITGTFNSGNVFTAELSDSTGSFASYTVLGTLTSTKGGNITITVPANAHPGSNYLIRVVSSNPATSSYANGCGYYKNAYTNNFYVTINQNPDINVTPSPSSYCRGGSSVLTASGATTYTWSPSTSLSATTGSSVIAKPTATKTYTVTGTNSTGCSAKNTVTVTVNPSTAITTQPVNVSTTAGSTAQFSVVATGLNLTYQWQVNRGKGYVNLSDNTVTSNVTTPTLTVTNVSKAYSGYIFRCVVTGTCNSVYSSGATLTITIQSQSEPENDVISAGSGSTSPTGEMLTIYPNPTSGQFTLKVSDNSTGYTIEIYNIMGQKIYQAVSGNVQNTIDLTGQAAGMYFVYVKSGEGVKVGKVLITK